MMERAWVLSVVLVAAAAVTTCWAVTPSTYLTADDLTRLEKLFVSHLTAQKDLQAVHYGLLGYKLIGKNVNDVQEVCKYLQSQLDPADISSLYFASKAAGSMLGCKLPVSTDTIKRLEDSLVDRLGVQDIYYTVETLLALGQKINSAAVAQTLQAALKKDDNVLSLGYGFHVASQLEGDLSQFVDRIEDALVQADEVDQKYLHFEGGVGITSTILTGAYRLSEKVNKRPALTDDQATKFANYLANRKTIQSVKGAYHLINGISMFCNNKFHLPVVISLASGSALSSARPRVEVRVSDLLGRALSHQLSVLAESATRLQDQAVVVSKSPFSPAADDKTVFELDLMASAPGSGFYNLVVSAKPAKPDSRLVGNTGAQLRVKVLTQMSVEELELGVADDDQSSAPRTSKLVQYTKLGQQLEADFHQKLLVRFVVQDKQSRRPLRCHQAFVRLVSKQSGREVIFVAEPDAALTYRFEMSVGAQAKRFGSESGVYQMELILGDAVIDNPVAWTMADVALKFSEPAKTRPADLYAPRPEIQHVFREAEPRPPALISSVFTALAALPLLVMLICWLRIGVNVSNFPVSLADIGFVAGIGGIFGLYYCFWLQLDMFTTVKYLCGLGVVTFLCGHSALSRLAANRKQH